eukprot:1082162-Alexandrium_andersonii.AAC.1
MILEASDDLGEVDTAIPKLQRSLSSANLTKDGEKEGEEYFFGWDSEHRVGWRALQNEGGQQAR